MKRFLGLAREEKTKLSQKFGSSERESTERERERNARERESKIQ